MRALCGRLYPATRLRRRHGAGERAQGEACSGASRSSRTIPCLPAQGEGVGNGAMPVPRRFTFRPGHDYATQRRESCGTAPLRSGSSPSRTHAIPRSLFVASHRRVLSREGQGRDSIEPRLLIASYCLSWDRAFHESLCGIGHRPSGRKEKAAAPQRCRNQPPRIAGTEDAPLVPPRVIPECFSRESRKCKLVGSRKSNHWIPARSPRE